MPKVMMELHASLDVKERVGRLSLVGSSFHVDEIRSGCILPPISRFCSLSQTLEQIEQRAQELLDQCTAKLSNRSKKRRNVRRRHNMQQRNNATRLEKSKGDAASGSVSDRKRSCIEAFQ
jgi:hypothetical protein